MDDRQRKQSGIAGERAALEHLSAAGLELVLRNYRCKLGEIDLVMLDRSRPQRCTLVFVEVRYRASSQFGGAAASVTWNKQRRLMRAAQSLLRVRRDLRCYPARFDVVAIEAGSVRWIRRAFEDER